MQRAKHSKPGHLVAIGDMNVSCGNIINDTGRVLDRANASCGAEGAGARLDDGGWKDQKDFS